MWTFGLEKKMIGEWLNSFGWGGLYVPVAGWLLAAIVVCIIVAIRGRLSLQPATIVLFTYIVLARMYINYFFSRPIGPGTDFGRYGSEFTGAFLWIGAAVAALYLPAAVWGVWRDRRKGGTVATGASAIIMLAVAILLYNTLTFPIKLVRSIPQDLKDQLAREREVGSKKGPNQAMDSDEQ